jgi:3-oxoacyl-[acyl-carrier protein] reductase
VTASSSRPWAVVTGASGGIGAAVAVALAGDGFDVVVHFHRNEDAALRVCEACASRGAGTLLVQQDLTVGVDRLEAAIDSIGGVSALVNNAGFVSDGLALTMTDEAFESVLTAHLTASFRMCRAALAGMTARRFGRIVNVSSVAGTHGNAGQANYASAKAGLIGLTKALAREVGRFGVTVNAVAPGLVDTTMTAGLPREDLLRSIPLGRAGRPEEVGAVVAFLCSEPAGYVNGAVVPVDGGLAW